MCTPTFFLSEGGKEAENERFYRTWVFNPTTHFAEYLIMNMVMMSRTCAPMSFAKEFSLLCIVKDLLW